MTSHELERLDRRAHRLVALSLFLLAAYIAIDAALSLWHRDRPASSPIGMGLTLISLAAAAGVTNAMGLPLSALDQTQAFIQGIQAQMRAPFEPEDSSHFSGAPEISPGE
jgi:hypothetical protein